ncbi:MAG TPA: nucleoside transporter C-terminal domain-containing protein [Hyphomonadaceae bacterium]|nr:nucleoside transporter C-terminal domain-containing protein [Hyphomonadaceae bacterium]
MNILIGIGGIVIILVLAVALSMSPLKIRLRVVVPAFLLQAAIAALVLYVPAGRAAIEAAAGGVDVLLGYSKAGINMVFGGLVGDNVVVFAINVLPIIVFFSALVSVLYYFRIIQLFVRWVGGFLQLVLGIDRVEAFYAAANILLGQSESPLVVRAYLPQLSDRQIFTLMTTGLAGVAGSILAAYAQMGVKTEYLLAAAFMSAPGGLLMGKLMAPTPPPAKDPPKPDTDLETGAEAEPVAGDTPIKAVPDAHEKHDNLILAIFNGTQDGVKLAVAVGAMLITFVALIALCNGILGGIAGLFGYPDLTFQKILGWVFSPIMYMLNVPWSESVTAGGFFGEKLILNEFVAYADYSKVMTTLSEHTQLVITFALCGFANISSIAIQMGVLGVLVPEKLPAIARMGPRAVLAGSLANLMSAALASLMLTISGG